MDKLSKWIQLSGNESHCCTRVIEGNDPSVIKNRIAFIEKSPRVRVRQYGKDSGMVIFKEDNQDIWIFGPKGSGGGNPEQDKTYGFDENSRKWCDDLLKLLGYEF